MARGWESKSVEEQMEEKTQSQPVTLTAAMMDQQRVAAAAKARERQSLELQRERILDERTSNPIRRAALEAALSEIEKKLAEL
jgi:hypothetical protein